MGPPSRREFVRASGLAVTVSVAGCSGTRSSDTSATPTVAPSTTHDRGTSNEREATSTTSGTATPGMPRHAVLATEKVNLTAEERDSAEILHFNSLPADEQALLEKALPNGSHVSCETPPDGSPWWSFAHRPERMEAYLEYQGAHYGVWLQITDMAFLETASYPSGVKEEACE